VPNKEENMTDRKAIVIGAGLGGLTSAAYLAKKEFRVDLFERHHTPGGYASSFVRGKYEFEVSLHQLSGIGPEENRGSCYRLLEGCDVARRVEFLPIHNFYTSRFPDFTVTIPNGWEAAQDAYTRQFPEEREGIGRLMRFMRSAFKGLQVATGKVGARDLLALSVHGTRLFRSVGLTVAQALDREIRNPRLKALFTNVWGFYGLPLSRLSFMLFTAGNASYFEYGPYHIKGTSQALSNAFVDAIEEKGGRVHMRNGVSRINVSDGKVTGVVDEQGESYEADHIVCNANPFHCCYDLMGRENVPTTYLKALAAGHIAMSTFNVYMGLDCPAEALGLTEHEFFVNDSYDLDEQYRSMFRIEKQKYWVITTYNTTDAEFSPPGTSVVVITTLQDYGAWSRVPPSEYVGTKNRMAAEMIDAADEIVPGLKDHIAVLEVSTPVTNMRYTGNPGGSILGFDYDLTHSPLFRLGNKGPLEGLYFANAWVRTGGGFEPCMVSGYMAYREVMKAEKK